MTIELSIETDGAPNGLFEYLSAVAASCAKTEGLDRLEASGRIVGDEEIHEINRTYRGVDRVTDVLSFPSVEYQKGTAKDNPAKLRRERNPKTGCAFLGDFVISLPQATRQAQEYGHSLRRELGYLTAHAIFHLMGYDHEREEDKRLMRQMEENAMKNVDAAREDADRLLWQKAVDALESAYAPYSGYRVGACVLAEDGWMFQGVNVENASYGLTICAERAAIANAIAHGRKNIIAIAVAGAKSVAWPCGACRQVLNEFGPNMRVLAGQVGCEYHISTLAELLPNAFGPENLQ